MEYLWGVVIFIFGAAIGSFVGVVADRYENGKLSFLKGRSFCFACNKVLRRLHLVPFFSFIFLKGRCGFCSSKIPFLVFAVEAVMGVLTVLLALKTGFLGEFIILDSYVIIQFLLLTAIFAIIVLISTYDLRHFIIPDSFLIWLFVLAVLHNSFFIIHDSFLTALSQYVASGVFLALPFFLIFFFSKGKWIGFGDIKYMAVLGFFLGFVEGLSAVVIAFWAGAVVSIVLLILNRLSNPLPFFGQKLTIKSEIPFGPFLSLGIVLSYFFSADVFQLRALFDFL